jgi:hypothetical protein
MIFGKIVNRDSSRGRRRGAVAAHYVAMALALVSWFGATSVDGQGLFWSLIVAFLVFSLVGGHIFVVVKSSTQRVAEQWGDGTLDERQRQVRDGAYRLAYVVLAGVFLLGLIFVQLAPFMDLPLPGRERASMLLPFGAWLVSTLPTTIIAWTELDPEPEGGEA